MQDTALLAAAGVISAALLGGAYIAVARRQSFNSYAVFSWTVGGAVAGAAMLTAAPRVGADLASIAVAGFVLSSAVVGMGLLTFLARFEFDNGPGANLQLVSFLLALWLVVSFLANGHSVSAFPAPLVSLFVPTSVIFLARAGGVSRDHLLRFSFRWSAVLVYVSLVLAVVGPSIAFGDSSQDLRRIPILGLDERLSGVAGHPNFLAILAVVMFTFAVTLPVRGRPVHVIFALVALVLTESRSGWITFAVAVAVLWIMRGQSVLRAMMAIPLIAALVLATGDWLANETTNLTADVADNGRFRVWESVLQNFPESPIWGWGPVAFRDASHSPLLGSGLAHAHNQFLQGLAEGGIVGLVLVLVLIGQMVRIGILYRRQAVYLTLAAIVLSSSVSEVLLNPHLWGANIGMVPVLVLMPAFVSAGRADDPKRWMRRQYDPGTRTAGADRQIQRAAPPVRRDRPGDPPISRP